MTEVLKIGINVRVNKWIRLGGGGRNFLNRQKVEKSERGHGGK